MESKDRKRRSLGPLDIGGVLRDYEETVLGTVNYDAEQNAIGSTSSPQKGLRT